MKTNQHTPAPWLYVVETKPFGGTSWHTVETPDGLIITEVYSDEGRLIQEANAHLVSAAPDLLGAVRTGVDLIEGDLTGPEWKAACHTFTKIARAAIAKALGESSRES